VLILGERLIRGGGGQARVELDHHFVRTPEGHRTRQATPGVARAGASGASAGATRCEQSFELGAKLATRKGRPGRACQEQGRPLKLAWAKRGIRGRQQAVPHMAAIALLNDVKARVAQPFESPVDRRPTQPEHSSNLDGPKAAAVPKEQFGNVPQMLEPRRCHHLFIPASGVSDRVRRSKSAKMARQRA
jgi:hypothetical protein